MFLCSVACSMVCTKCMLCTDFQEKLEGATLLVISMSPCRTLHRKSHPFGIPMSTLNLYYFLKICTRKTQPLKPQIRISSSRTQGASVSGRPSAGGPSLHRLDAHLPYVGCLGFTCCISDNTLPQDPKDNTGVYRTPQPYRTL